MGETIKSLFMMGSIFADVFEKLMELISMDKEVEQIKKAINSLQKNGIEFGLNAVLIKTTKGKARMIRMSVLSTDPVTGLGIIEMMKNLLELSREAAFEKIDKDDSGENIRIEKKDFMEVDEYGKDN